MPINKRTIHTCINVMRYTWTARISVTLRRMIGKSTCIPTCMSARRYSAAAACCSYWM